MSEDRRVQELQAEVHRLRRELARARGAAESPVAKRADAPNRRAAAVAHRDVHEPFRVDTRDAAELIDWSDLGSGFSRGTVIFLMTVMAIGAVSVFSGGEEALRPWQRVAAGYAVALGCVTLGWFSRERQHPVAHLLLGAGLAALYAATYAACYTEGIGPFSDPRVRWPLMMGCLALMLGAVHERAGKSSAGIALIAVYYTVAVTATSARSHDALVYAMVVCAALPPVTALFELIHHWRFLVWVTCLAAYGTFYLVFWSQPAEIVWAAGTYRLVAGTATTVCFVAFGLATLIEARRALTPSVRTALAGLLNAGLYVVWMRDNWSAGSPLWPLYTGVAIVLTGLALGVEMRRPRLALLTQVYTACATVLLALSAFDALGPAKTLPACAAITLLVTILAGVTGMPAAHALALLGALIVLGMAVPEVSMPGRVGLWGLVIPAKWFSGVGVALLLCTGAWYLTHHGAAQRRPWQGTRLATHIGLRMPAFTMAGGAALLVLTLTVFDIGEDPILPFALAFAGAVIAGLGLVTQTPAIELSSFAVLAGAHLTWHMYLHLDRHNFTLLEGFGAYSVLLGAATGFSALLWERYLEAADARKPLDHYAVAALPWVAMTALWIRLADHWFAPGYVPVALAALGAGLVATGYVVRSTGAIIASVPAFALTAAVLARALNANPAYLPGGIGILAYLTALLGAFAVAERLLFALERRRISRYRLDDLYRTVLVATAGAAGLLVLHMWSQTSWVLMWWALHALVGMGLGFLFAESRYYWAALFVLVMIGIRGVLYDLNALPMPMQVLTLLLAMGSVLALARWYVRYRAQRPHAHARG